MERKGICNNVGVCTKIGKIQIISDDDADFVCPECGEPLEPCKDEDSADRINSDIQKGKRKKLLVFVLAALFLLGGLGFGIYSLFCSKPEPTAIKLNFTNLTIAVGEQKQLIASLLPEKADQKVTFIYTALKDDAYKKGRENTKIVEADNATGMLTAMRPGVTSARVTCKEYPKLKAICNITVKSVDTTSQPPVTSGDTTKATTTDTAKKVSADNASDKMNKRRENYDGKNTTTPKQQGHGTVKTSYGTYTGYLRNGKPHGHGKMRFFKQYRLGGSGYSASAGDTYEGEFRDGLIAGGDGYLTRRDGEEIKIIP